MDIGNSRAEDELISRLGTFKTLSARLADGGKMVHSLRSVGCTSVNLCLVASGGQDMCVAMWCELTQGTGRSAGGRGTFVYVALARGGADPSQAGMAILSEAGGVTFGGKDSDLSGDVDAALLG